MFDHLGEQLHTVRGTYGSVLRSAGLLGRNPSQRRTQNADPAMRVMGAHTDEHREQAGGRHPPAVAVGVATSGRSLLCLK